MTMNASHGNFQNFDCFNARLTTLFFFFFFSCCSVSLSRQPCWMELAFQYVRKRAEFGRHIANFGDAPAHLLCSVPARCV